MESPIIIALIASNLVILLILVFKWGKKESNFSQLFDNLDKSLSKIEIALRDDLRINREENSSIGRENRIELNGTLNDFRKELSDTLKEITNQSKTDNALFRDTLINSFRGIQDTFDKNVSSFNPVQREKFAILSEEQKNIVESTEK